MKTAILLHGTGGNDKDYFWFADTKQFLESKGYEVWWPLLPHTEKPNLQETLEFVRRNLPEVNQETIIIGHSSACPVILSLLQDLPARLKQAVLVSGFYRSLNDDGYSDLMLPKEGFDFDKIRNHAAEIIMINSDNDPWGCNDKQAQPVAEKLGAKFILAKGQGHMGSGSFNQPYRDFPLLKEVIGRKNNV